MELTKEFQRLVFKVSLKTPKFCLCVLAQSKHLCAKEHLLIRKQTCRQCAYYRAHKCDTFAMIRSDCEILLRSFDDNRIAKSSKYLHVNIN